MKELFLNSLNIKENNDLSLITSSPKNLSSNAILNNPEVSQQLRHVLKSYSLLSKQRIPEQLFTNHIVKPYLDEVSYSKTKIKKD